MYSPWNEDQRDTTVQLQAKQPGSIDLQEGTTHPQGLTSTGQQPTGVEYKYAWQSNPAC